jgi:hypothetical protein
MSKKNLKIEMSQQVFLFLTEAAVWGQTREEEACFGLVSILENFLFSFVAYKEAK